MAKQLNKNLVLGLSVLGFAITTAAGVVMVKLLQKSDPAEFAMRAEEFSKKEDWSRACQYYNQAYRTSKDVQYLVLAADMLRKMGKENDALRSYKTAVVMNPDSLDAQEKLLDLLLEIANLAPDSTASWLDVRQTAEAILELPEQSEHPRALYALGAALLGLKEQSPENESMGLEYLERSVAANPSSIEPVRSLVQHYYSLLDPKNPVENEKWMNKAGSLLEKSVAQNSTPGEDAAEARSMLAQHHLRKEDFPKAAELYAQAEAMAGSDKEVQAKVFARVGQFWATRWSILTSGALDEAATPEEIDQALAKSEAAANKAIEVHPESFEGYFLLAEVQRRRGNIDKSIEVLQSRLKLPFEREGFKSILTRYNRYALLIALADLNTALASDHPRGSEEMEKYLSQARMYIVDAEGEFHERPEASHSRGKIAYVEGELTEAVSWFEKSDKQSVRPNPTNLHYLALARLQLGQLGGAHEAIQRAASRPDASAAIYATYSQILLRMGRDRDALEVANVAVQRDPRSEDARVAVAAARERLGQLKETGEALDFETDRPELIAAKARLLARQKEHQQAIDLLNKALEKAPAHPLLVATSALVHADAGRRADAQAIIDQALQQNPDNFELRLTRLQYSDLEEEARAAEYRKLIETLPDEYDRAIRLATVFGEAGDDAKQREHLIVAKDLILKQSTDSARRAGEPALRYIIDRLIEIESRAENFEALDELVAQASAWNDSAGLDGAEGLSYRGRRVLIDAFLTGDKAQQAFERGDTAEAERLRELSQRHYRSAIDTLLLALDKFPSSGETYAQLGEAYLQTNRSAEARAAMEKANDLLPRNPLVLKRLALICRRLNDQAAYATWIQRCQEVTPDDPWVMEQVLVQQEEQNAGEGIARREQIRAKNPDDLANLAALARLYSRVGDVAKAEECVNFIAEADTAGDYLGSVASTLRDIGKPERAYTILEQHLRKVPDDKKAEAQLAIADHFAILNDPRADAAYLAAADIDPNETVCIEIGQHFFRTGRYRVADEWFAKAEDLAKAANSVRQSIISQVRIDTALRLDQLEVARERCEAFRAAYPDDPSGIFLNAEILNAEGETEKAIQTLTEYLDKSKRGTNWVNDYRRQIALFRRAQFNFNRGRLQDAIDDLSGLAATDPTALKFTPRVLLARAYEDVGRPDAALTELESVYRSYPEASNAIAALVDRYIKDKRYEDADRVLATMLNRQPNNVEWLTRSGDVAMEQNDRSKALASYQAAAKAAGYAPDVTNKVFEACAKFKIPDQGIQFFEEAIPPGQRSPEIILGYARLAAMRGDASEAVDLVRLALHRKGYGSFEFLMKLGAAIEQMFGRDALKQFEVKPAEAVFERSNQHILSLLQQNTGNLDESDKINRALLESSTDQAEQAQLWFRIGLIHNARGQTAEARAAYEKALELDDRHEAALNNLAYLLSSDPSATKEAVKYARRALEAATATSFVETLDTLGWAHLCDGDNLSAIAKLAQAREYDPDYVPATYHLAEAYRRQGEFEPAQRLFEEVISTPAGGEYQEFVDQARSGLEKARNRQSD